MGLEIDDAHGRALADTGRLVAGVRDDQWGLPTPCDDWDVRTLVHHIVYGNFWVAPLMGGETIEEVGDRFEGDILGDDAEAAYIASAAAADAAVRADGALDAPAAVSYGPVPGRVYASHRFLDVLVHGWDLAMGTGQDTTLAPDLVTACLEIVRAEPGLAGSGAFGTDHHVPEGADEQTELLALLGRHASS